MGDTPNSLTPKQGQTYQIVVKAETGMPQNPACENDNEIISDFEENLFENKLAVEPIVVQDSLSEDFLDEDNSITLDLDRSQNEGKVLELDLSKKKRGKASVSKKNLSCVLCHESCSDQKRFFAHLKTHYVAKSTREQFGCCICNESFFSQVDYFIHLRGHYEPSVMAQLGGCITVTRLNSTGDPSQPHILEPSRDRKLFLTKSKKEQDIEDLDWTVEYMIPENGSKSAPTKSGRIPIARAWDADMVSLSPTRIKLEPRSDRLNADVSDDNADYTLEDLANFSDNDFLVERHVPDPKKSNTRIHPRNSFPDRIMRKGGDSGSFERIVEYQCNLCGKRLPDMTAINVHYRLHIEQGYDGPQLSYHPQKIIKRVKIKEDSSKDPAFSLENESSNTTHLFPAAQQSNPGVPEMTQSHPSQQQPGQKPGPIEWKPKKIRKGLTHPDAKRVQEVENGPVKLECPLCKKLCCSTGTLTVHLRVHKGEMPFQCKICGRRFRQSYQVKHHHTVHHTDIRAYQCEVCGKHFPRAPLLSVHRKMHTGEKNYACEFCPKRFRAISHLKNHRRTHTGEKPHICDICGKGFAIKSTLKKHYRGIHRVFNKFPKQHPNTFQKVEEEDTQQEELEDVHLQEEQQDGQFPRLVFINDQEAILVHQ